MLLRIQDASFHISVKDSEIEMAQCISALGSLALPENLKSPFKKLRAFELRASQVAHINRRTERLVE